MEIHDISDSNQNPLNPNNLSAAIVESADDAIITKNTDGIITSWNGGAVKIYGYSADEIIGQHIAILTPPEFGSEIPPILEKIRRGETIPHYETMRLRKDGIVINVSISISPIKDRGGKIVGATAIARDITSDYKKRKEAEDRLNEASKYARSLIEASLDPLVTISPDGKITDVNEATIKVTGVERDKLVGTDFSSCFTEPDNAQKGYRRVFAEGFVTDYPLTIKHLSGKLTDVLYNASIYKDTSGNVTGVFAAARDVTDRVKNDAKLSGLLESAPDAMVIVDHEGVITMVNSQTEFLFGYERNEIIGRKIEILIPERYGERHIGHRTGYTADPKIRAMWTGLELYGLRRDRTEFPAEIKLSPMKLKDELLIIAAVRDVTEQKKAAQYARSLIEASLDPLVTINPEGKITDVNEATIKVTGIEREKLIGTDFTGYFTEPVMAQEGYRLVFAKGYVTDYPLTIRHRDGHLTDVLYNASIYKDTMGNILGVFAAARDITERRKTEQELSEQRRKEQEKLVELERFQKLTVGRELKMIDLKKEIEELRKENAELKLRI
jgi:PAS domain S-box-containing protein